MRGLTNNENKYRTKQEQIIYVIKIKVLGFLSMSDDTYVCSANYDVLEEVRSQISRLERDGRPEASVVCLGVPEIDFCLPGGGLAGGAVHEIIGEVATGFAVLIAAQLNGPILWCVDAAQQEKLYGPGLQAIGIDSSRLILAPFLSLGAFLSP